MSTDERRDCPAEVCDVTASSNESGAVLVSDVSMQVSGVDIVLLKVPIGMGSDRDGQC